jgi:protein SCO1
MAKKAAPSKAPTSRRNAAAPLDPFRPPSAADEPEVKRLSGPSVGLAAKPARSGGVSKAAAAVILGSLALVVVALFAIVFTAAKPLGTASQAPVTGGVILAANDPAVKPAPAINLTDTRGRPFSLSSLQGRPVLVFFGYTHCPDVCPATTGVINEALSKAGLGPRVVFVSIDPERDTVDAMATYTRYLPRAYIGLTGTLSQVRSTADAWGVQYAKQQNETGGYAMAHTADVWLVDAQGRIRGTFIFGTTADPIAAALTKLMTETAPPSATIEPPASRPAPGTSVAVPTPVASGDTAGQSLAPLVVSSEIWAGGPDPIILNVYDAKGAMLDGTTPVDVTITGANNAVAVQPVRAVPVKPWGEKLVYYVATLTIPSPGGWQLDVATPDGRKGSVAITAQDQGATIPLGAKVPDIHTPTLADVNNVVRAVTTQPQPDLRLSQKSTSDSRAAGRPFVIVIDSARFKVSPLCGKALVMVRYLIDRWQDTVDFIHLEPFTYTIVTDEPVLSGDISNPPINQWASAYGLGPAPWTGLSVPWAFVVDSQGIVRAKYQGIIGSADLDVIISLMNNNGVIGQ